MKVLLVVSTDDDDIVEIAEDVAFQLGGDDPIYESLEGSGVDCSPKSITRNYKNSR